MFNAIPDPAWEYAQLWAEMREIYFKLREIEMKLSHPDAEQKNRDVDEFVISNLKQIKETGNKWSSGEPEIF